MKNFIKIFSIVLFGGFYTLEAQQIVKKDTLAGTELVMTMDPKVNAALESIEDKCARTAATIVSGNGDDGSGTTGNLPMRRYAEEIRES